MASFPRSDSRSRVRCHNELVLVLPRVRPGGGLTVIANAPKPAGPAILLRYFREGVAPLKLATAAVLPTVIVCLCYMAV